MSNTESTVIQPAPGQSILTTSNGHQNHGAWGSHEAFASLKFNEALLREQSAGFRVDNITSQNAIRDLERGFNATALAQCRMEQQIQVTTAALALEAAKNFGAQELRATTIACETQAKIAECCCKQELVAAQNFAAMAALVTAQGTSTRELINELRTRDLERLLASIPRGIPVTLPPAPGV